MDVTAYLNFNGQCEAAFKFYEQHLGARVGAIFRYAGSPMADQAPAGWENKIMHGNLTIGQMALMGADVRPLQYEKPQGFSLSIQTKDPVEAERLFLALSEGGAVLMPLAKTFWAERFGMVVDQFGIPWMINCEGSPAS